MKTTEGIASLNALASATAQRIPTIKAGLEWLDRSGYINLISIKGDEVRLECWDQGRKIKLQLVDTSQIKFHAC